ncbi:AAA family ATPase [Parashewanella tropica]|uniref:AAA family ATPase n=1 Tax=Parashewanella tropica TaxID=2547970 RepID=UPI00105A87BE|nr:AAA family ATPase [Parashewanella tropica]
MKVYYSTSPIYEDITGIFLRLDNVGTYYSSPWDDFGYTVTFDIYAVRENQESHITLGRIKLLTKDHDDTSKYFEENGTKTDSKSLIEITDILEPERFVSLGTDLDYYRKIQAYFDSEESVDDYLSVLCDLSFNSSNYEEISQWEGFSFTIMRDSSAKLAIYKKGYAIARGRYEPEHNFSIEIDSLPETFEPVDFSFDAKRKIGESRINLLIGKNGVGKTHILRHITEIISGFGNEPSKWPFFHKLLVIAFSPFENFYTKTQILELLDKKRKKKTKKNDKSKKRKLLAINEYAYIGFRNEGGSFDLNLPNELSAKSIENILSYDNENNWWDTNNRLKTLFSTLKLSIDFDEIRLISKNESEITLNADSKINPKNFKHPINYVKGIRFYLRGEQVELSSGQLIYSYMIPSIVSEIKEESLIILDEPELYLHPSMEIGLIEMLRRLLKETSSYALIASHSSVLAREIEKNSIRILRKTNGKTIVSPPSFETYGASLEKISKEVFDDSITDKPFEDDLDKLVKSTKSIEKVIQKHGGDLGDSALIYLASKATEDNEEKIELTKE